MGGDEDKFTEDMRLNQPQKAHEPDYSITPEELKKPELNVKDKAHLVKAADTFAAGLVQKMQKQFNDMLSSKETSKSTKTILDSKNGELTKIFNDPKTPPLGKFGAIISMLAQAHDEIRRKFSLSKLKGSDFNQSNTADELSFMVNDLRKDLLHLKDVLEYGRATAAHFYDEEMTETKTLDVSGARDVLQEVKKIHGGYKADVEAEVKRAEAAKAVAPAQDQQQQAEDSSHKGPGVR